MPDICELPPLISINERGYILKKYSNFFSPTLVFVGISVMKQWKRAIEEFTTLKAFIVNTVYELRTLLVMMASGDINKYDIILVKNGQITVEIDLPMGLEIEKKNKVKHPYFYNILSNFRQHCWARVVVDDFDTIKLPHNASIVNALFTWYVSSTRHPMHFVISEREDIYSAEDYLTKSNYGCAGIMSNEILFRILNVRNNREYIKDTTNIPNPKYWYAVFQNPNNRYISVLNGMGEEETNRIVEMLNGDAINAAAEAAGIKTNSVANIFEKILGEKFSAYRFAGDLLAFIEHCKETEEDRLPMEQNPDVNDRYTKKHLLAFKEIEYKYPGVNTLLKDTEVEYTGIKERSGIAIQRVKDNIKTGRCPICRDDLNSVDDAAITKCCGTVFCGNCAIEGQNLKNRYQKLKGRCANCRAEITIKDLIYMENFDLEKIEKEEFEDEEEKVDIKKVAVKRELTKYTAITDIINGQPVSNAKRIDMHIPNMMKGKGKLPESAIRKVLIFANYEETLQKIAAELEEQKIHYWRLMGSAAEIDRTATDFNKCETTCAMIINSAKHCSGLNLQTATDLIFAHFMIDGAIESQVAGRGHRLGRKSPLNIWYLVYDNEITQIKNKHNMREMTAEEVANEDKEEEIKAVDNVKVTVSKKRTKKSSKYEHNKRKTNVDNDSDGGSDKDGDNGSDKDGSDKDGSDKDGINAEDNGIDMDGIDMED
jgi:hypothetical protein